MDRHIQSTDKKTEEIDFYGHLKKIGFEWEDTSLTFKYTVEHLSDKKKIKK